MKHILIWFACVLFLAASWGCSRKSDTTQATSATPQQSAAPAPPAPVKSPDKLTPEPSASQTGIIINGRELSRTDAMGLISIYHYAPPPGRYWYDTVSGAWGIEGREALGFILPGHDLGPLAANASAGNTGVFINGRELNLAEAANIQRTFGAVYQGRWWLDGRTGYYGVEGTPAPMGNIIAALQAQRSNGSGDNFWSSRTAVGNSSGGCSYVNVGGTTASSGCD